MPTPFTHLETAQRLLTDERVPESTRDFLRAELGAFLLGNIAADARVSLGLDREQTHFYAYSKPIVEHPWRVMLARYPSLRAKTSAGQRAFMAGYVAHLSMDEYWSLHMVRPHFAAGTWLTEHRRFVMLNILLIHMDERDYPRLCGWQQPTLTTAAQPANWTPFMSDDDLRGWRDFVGAQLPPVGVSQTLDVLAPRIAMTPNSIRALLDSPEQMTRDLWRHVPPPLAAQVEAGMYAFAREQMSSYLDETEED